VKAEPLASVDPEIAGAIARELERQQFTLEMIASENIASPAVMAAQGSVLTNKYAEGYPDRRYYGGCQFVDQAEALAIERARTLFAAEYANVQPHSGSQANMAVYFALLSPGDRIAPRPTWPSTSPCCRPATGSWAWTWPTAGISPTAAR